MKKQVTAPFKPFVTGPEDTRNIDKMFLNEAAKETPAENSNMSPTTKQINHFDEFTYNGTTKNNVLSSQK